MGHQNRHIDRSNDQPPLRKLYEDQGGVAARWQLRDVGFGDGSVEWSLHSGKLVAHYEGVYSPVHRAISTQGRLMAAVLASGRGAVLSHQSAASWWGIRKAGSAVIHTTALTHRAGHPGVRVHRSRTLLPRDATFHEDLPITTVARTLLDLAGVLGKQQLTKTCSEAERYRLLDMREFEDVIERSNGRRGVKNLIEAVREEYPLTKSDFEDEFHAFLAERGFPTPITNAWLSVGDGWEPDVRWPTERVIVELDSWQWHGTTRRDFERDRRRDTQLEAAGWRVIRITWARFHAEPDAIEAELRSILAG